MAPTDPTDPVASPAPTDPPASTDYPDPTSSIARSTARDLLVNLVATAIYILIGLGVSRYLGTSESLSITFVAVAVAVLGLSLLVLSATNLLNKILRPLAIFWFLALVVSVLFNFALVFRAIAPNKVDQIQSLQPFIIAYGGDYDDKVNTWGSCSYNTHYLTTENVAYEVTYNLPEDKGDDVWAGLSFQFLNQQNLSQYKQLELTITFGDPKYGGDTQANAYLIVRARDKSAVINLRDAKGVGTQNERTVTIDMSTDIKDLDLTAVREISFGTDGSLPRGSHIFTVSNIRLLRP